MASEIVSATVEGITILAALSAAFVWVGYLTGGI